MHTTQTTSGIHHALTVDHTMPGNTRAAPSVATVINHDAHSKRARHAASISISTSPTFSSSIPSPFIAITDSADSTDSDLSTMKEPDDSLLSDHLLLDNSADHHAVARPPSADRSVPELAQMTFSQWLDYHLAHPAFASKRKYLFSDEEYLCLLDLCVSGMRISEFVAARQLDDKQASWLYRATI